MLRAALQARLKLQSRLQAMASDPAVAPFQERLAITIDDLASRLSKGDYARLIGLSAPETSVAAQTQLEIYERIVHFTAAADRRAVVEIHAKLVSAMELG